jgi:hypothetical protein
MDPDQGGPKTCGSGSATLQKLFLSFGSGFSSHSGSRIQGSKNHCIPDPDLQHRFTVNRLMRTSAVVGLGSSFEFRLFRESRSWFPRIQIQALMTKNIKIIFLIKIAIYFFLLIEGLPSYRRSPQPSKETIIKFFTFFLFGSFYLPGFGS